MFDQDLLHAYFLLLKHDKVLRQLIQVFHEYIHNFMKIAVWVLNKTSQPPSLEATISRGGLSCQVTSFKAFYS